MPRRMSSALAISLALAVSRALAGTPVSAGSGQKGPSVERLVVVAPDGTIVGVSTGDQSHARIGPELGRAVRTPGARLLLTHNHPAGTGLSAADLGLLVHPGVAAIEAIGEEGSRYRASLGRSGDPVCLEKRLYPVARAAVFQQLRQYLQGAAWKGKVESQLDRGDFDEHVSHLVAYGLHKARIIVYRAELGKARRESYARHRVLFGYASEAAAASVRNVAQRCHASAITDVAGR